MSSNQEVTRFNSYALPTIQITKYIDQESSNGSVMYDLYLDGVREQRYDINGLLYRLELMLRLAGVKPGQVIAIRDYKPEGSNEDVTN